MEEVFAVGVVPEDRPPLIAPGRHVVHSPFILDPLRPRHAAILSPSPTLHKHEFDKQNPLSIKKGLTPPSLDALRQLYRDAWFQG